MIQYLHIEREKKLASLRVVFALLLVDKVVDDGRHKTQHPNDTNRNGCPTDGRDVVILNVRRVL